ncbi:conserved membrane hypothetical protein [Exiguobacterium oxidotolerans]|uniref:Uncharacterized protein n=2 Tax=Exiguobacterium oxidotolerans TaxID=223958 RepID=A0A653IGJ8_9BACL|nr:conserved membrane hypothetical protein [Exiguobacterium oxidotolerans]
MNGDLKKMQWLIFSKTERERLHPLNVALFLMVMLSVPFVLHDHIGRLVLVHLVFFITIRQFEVFRYLMLPLLYTLMMMVPLLYGASIDVIGILAVSVQITLFITSSQLVFTLVRLEQMGPLFRMLPRLTRLTGLVLALIPSLLRTWPEVKMSHRHHALSEQLERMAMYHLLPIDAVPSRLRKLTLRDIRTGVILLSVSSLLLTPYAYVGAVVLPMILLCSKGAFRDANDYFKRQRSDRTA